MKTGYGMSYIRGRQRETGGKETGVRPLSPCLCGKCLSNISFLLYQLRSISEKLAFFSVKIAYYIQRHGKFTEKSLCQHLPPVIFPGRKIKITGEKQV